MTDCNDALRELYEFLDGELTDEKRDQIKHHIEDCGSCLEVFDFEVELRMVVQKKCEEPCPDALRAKIEAALQAAGEAPPEGVEPPPA